MLLATKVLVGFLRGLLTNLGTPPVASDIRSILVRPRLLENEFPRNTIFHCVVLFALSTPRQASSPFGPLQ